MKRNSAGAQCIRRTHFLRADEYICSRCGYSGRKPFASCPRCGVRISKNRYDANWVDEAEMIDIMLGG